MGLHETGCPPVDRLREVRAVGRVREIRRMAAECGLTFARLNVEPGDFECRRLRDGTGWSRGRSNCGKNEERAGARTHLQRHGEPQSFFPRAWLLLSHAAR